MCAFFCVFFYWILILDLVFYSGDVKLRGCVIIIVKLLLIVFRGSSGQLLGAGGQGALLDVP